MVLVHSNFSSCNFFLKFQADEPGEFHLDEDLLSQEDDLKMLRSGNEDEVTEDLLTFHNVINQCEKLEEEVVDQHREIVDVSS